MAVQNAVQVLDREDFNAGSDYDDGGSFEQDVMGAPEPAPTAEEGDSQVESTEDAEAAEQPEQPAKPIQGSDKDGQAKPAPAKPAPQTATAPTKGEIAVKHGDAMVKFALNPEDKQLRDTLAMGLGARKWQAERDDALKRATAAETTSAEMKSKVETWDTLDELAKLNQPEMVAAALLGDEGMKALRAQIIHDYNIETAGSDDEKAAVSKARAARERLVKDHFAKKDMDKRDAALKAKEDEIEAGRLHGLGQIALRRFSFNKLIPDNDTAEAFNQDMWHLAWTDLEQLSETREVTGADVTEAFQRRHKRLAAAIAQKVDAKVESTLATKTTEARRTAAVRATARYPAAGAGGAAPGSLDEAVTQWDGRSVNGLFDLLRRR